MKTVRHLVALVFLCHSPVAIAQVGVVEAPATDALLSVVIQEMSTELAAQYEQVAQLVSTVVELRAIFEQANTIASYVRQTKELYDTVRNYSSQELARDAKLGLYAAFPELQGVEREIRLTLRDANAIETNTFFSNYNYHDPAVRGHLDSVAGFGVRASLYSALFPDSEAMQDHVTKADRLMAHRFARVGLTPRRQKQDAVLGAFQKRAKEQAEEAAKNGRIDQAMEGVRTQMAVQNTANTQAIRDGIEADIAEKENQLLIEQGTNNAIGASLRNVFDGVDAPEARR